MSDKFYIPNKLTVGFSTEDKASTGKLAQLTYKDANGRIIKEKTWRQAIDDVAHTKRVFSRYEMDKNNKPIYSKPIYKDLSGFPIEEIDNIPTKGFILNKTDKKVNWDNSPTTSYFYDPRGFEVTISMNNLLYILQLTKGNYADTSFVYSWVDDNMMLLPCNSEEYISSVEFKDVKSMKFSLKDLKPGCMYHTKNLDRAVYIGRYDYIELDQYINSLVGFRRITTSKVHMFVLGEGDKKVFTPMTSSHLAKIVSNDVVANYQQLVDELEASGKVFPVERVDLIPITVNDILQKERDIKANLSNYINYNNTKEHFIGYVTQPKGANKYEAFKLFQIRRFNGNYNKNSININFDILGYKLKPSYQEYTIDGANICIKNTKTLTELKNMSFDRTGIYIPQTLTEEQINALNLTKVKLKFKKSEKLKVI